MWLENTNTELQTSHISFICEADYNETTNNNTMSMHGAANKNASYRK